ncbi:hypothetical protein, partial [Pseudophaeobacter sp.]|uniref:hypothetical protein n=1 Tax=Pseudophaeobacter sp. TaxID=1971739 RepID=UPI003297A590
MSSFNNRLELLQAYATEQFSSNDNKVQALINTVEWVMKFAEGLPTTSEQIDQIVVDMKRLFIGDGLSRNEGDFFIGHSIMIGTGGFQEELQDSGNQIQHAVAGLCGSLYSPAFGFVGGFSELVTAAMRDEPVNQPDIELYSRMHSFASEVHIFGVEDLIDGLIREIGDETVVHPDFTSSSTSGTTVTLESFSPEPEPKLKIEASTTAEGNTLFFRVYIDGEAVQHDISFRAITFQGTTSEFSPNGASPDYDGINATYVIPAGQTEVFVPVETEDDDLPEFMEVVELIVTETQGAENPVLVGLGTILDDDVAGFSFGAANFTTDLSGVLATASYTISHNGDDDETGVRVNAYIDSNGNGIWDSGDAHVGYESASTLRVGENDSEVIDLDGLRAYL